MIASLHVSCGQFGDRHRNATSGLDKIDGRHRRVTFQDAPLPTERGALPSVGWRITKGDGVAGVTFPQLMDNYASKETPSVGAADRRGFF